MAQRHSRRLDSHHQRPRRLLTVRSSQAIACSSSEALRHLTTSHNPAAADTGGVDQMLHLQQIRPTPRARLPELRQSPFVMSSFFQGTSSAWLTSLHLVHASKGGASGTTALSPLPIHAGLHVATSLDHRGRSVDSWWFIGGTPMGLQTEIASDI